MVSPLHEDTWVDCATQHNCIVRPTLNWSELTSDSFPDTMRPIIKAEQAVIGQAVSGTPTSSETHPVPRSQLVPTIGRRALQASNRNLSGLIGIRTRSFSANMHRILYGL